MSIGQHTFLPARSSQTLRPKGAAKNIQKGYFSSCVNAQLTCRPVQEADLRNCLLIQPVRNGAERIGLNRALRAWKIILRNPDSSVSYLVEKAIAQTSEIVGFGMAVFVTSSFADSMLSNPQPGLNARIIESVDAGKSVIPSYRYLQTANADATLDHVVMYSSEKPERLSPNELGLVRNQLARAYMESFVGYRLRRMLYEITTAEELEKIKGYRGIRVVARTTAPDLPGIPSLWKQERALCEATAETIVNDPASVAVRPFVERRLPVLDFSPSQKRLLLAALREAENAELAVALCRTPAAIKRTWSGIFEKCTQHIPALIPTNKNLLRGQQKRHKVIAYIREHPEEIRPFPPRSAGCENEERRRQS
jgi:hypothetical protein